MQSSMLLLIHILPKPGNNPRLFFMHSKAAPIGAARRKEIQIICHDKKCHWSCRLDLNQRPADYKSAALPLKLQQRIAGLSRLSGKFDK